MRRSTRLWTDPPHGISFLGRAWDGLGELRQFQAWVTRWAAECLRVLKPGGHLLAFGGARTYHRLAAGVENAGFDIRDQLMWIYAQGMPKSHDVSKAIDKAGAVRPVIGKSRWSQPAKSGHHGGLRGSNVVEAGERFRPDVTGPATAAAKE
jgi:hypothetical protein